MKKLSVKDFAPAIGGKTVNLTDKEVFINGVTMDSRKVLPGNLFVAIKGERVDGHDFIKDVFEKGAAAVLCDHVPEGVNGVCIVVENTVKGLQDLAEYYRKSLPVKVVGITGSVGKTSTKEMVASVLSVSFKVLKTIGNYNNEIGLPLTVLSIEEDDEVAVLEMGISDFGEMRVLSKVARPDICVMTNIGQCHLEMLGSRDGILKAKSEIFEYMNPEGFVFVNGDDDKLITVKEVNGKAPTLFGMGAHNYAHPINVESLGLKGTEMTVCLGEKSFDAHIRMIGNHMVINAMVASAIGELLGMSNEDIAKGLEMADTIGGRSHLIERKGGFVIDDCYNASPTSMKAALDTLNLAIGRKVAILGDMFELGSDSDKMHAEIGEYASTLPIDLLVTVGDNCRHMYEAAVKGGIESKTLYFENLDSLLKELDNIVKDGDNVLVKASHGMEFTKVIEALTK